MITIKPTGIKADRTARTISIVWNDDHTSTFSFDGLRIACPCVECKGGHSNMGKATPASVVANAPVTDLELVDLQSVGAYAIQPTWSDGHSNGIYSWGLLRAIDIDLAG
jgi:DUF971 family protein